MEVVKRSNAGSTKDDGYELVVLSDGRFYRRRKRKPRPKGQLPKGFLPEEKVSLAEALARIDHSHLAAFLAVAPECRPGTEVFELLYYFGSALSGVSSVEYQYPWPNMNNLMDLIDLPFRHVPAPVYDTVEDWIEKVEEVSVSNFIMWSFECTRNRLSGIYTNTEPDSQLGLFVALSIILRSRSLVLSPILPVLREKYYHLETAPEMFQFTVWMMAQVAQVDCCSGLQSWASNLLPLVRDKLKDNPHSMDLILQLIENVLSHPRAVDIILEDAEEDEIVFPIPSFEILLPLTFPASFERVHVTKRFEAVYPMLKEVALAGAPGIEGITQIFDFSLKFAREGNPALAKEATAIAIWCVTKNTQDTERFEAFYPLLKEVALADDAQGRTSMIQITPHIFVSSLKFAGEGNAVLAKEATSIAILCLTKNVDCCNHWDRVYMDYLEDSVALLKNLVDEWKDHSLKLSSSPRDTRILNLTMKVFMLKNEQGITEGGAKCSFHKEADKYCKEILRRLSSGNGFLKGCLAISVVVILVAVLLHWSMQSPQLVFYADGSFILFVFSFFFFLGFVLSFSTHTFKPKVI